MISVLRKRIALVLLFLTLTVIFVFVGIGVLNAIFYVEHEPPFIIEDYLETILLEQLQKVEKGKMSKDIKSWAIWNGNLQLIQNRTYAPDGKCLIIYNKSYSEKQSDWVAVIGYNFDISYSTTKYAKLFKSSGETSVIFKPRTFYENHVKGRSDLEYYYLDLVFPFGRSKMESRDEFIEKIKQAR